MGSPDPTLYAPSQGRCRPYWAIYLCFLLARGTSSRPSALDDLAIKAGPRPGLFQRFPPRSVGGVMQGDGGSSLYFRRTKETSLGWSVSHRPVHAR